MGIDNPVTLSDGGLNNELLVGDDDYFENLVLPDDWLGFGFNQDWDAGQFALDADYLQVNIVSVSPLWYCSVLS